MCKHAESLVRVAIHSLAVISLLFFEAILLHSFMDAVAHALVRGR
jgi:hypothetical protein